MSDPASIPVVPPPVPPSSRKFPMPMPMPMGGEDVTVKVEPEEEEDEVEYVGTFPAECPATCESPLVLPEGQEALLNIPLPQDKAPICKRNVRGHCDRGERCLYRHAFDLAELRGLFVFCRDYQHRVCARPRCPFVHASAAEEMTFLRTGEVPLGLRLRARRVKEEGRRMPPLPPPPPEALWPSMPLLMNSRQCCDDRTEEELYGSDDVSNSDISAPCADKEPRWLGVQPSLAQLSGQWLPPDTASPPPPPPPPALVQIYEASYEANLQALLQDMLPSQQLAAAMVTRSHFENLMHFLANRDS